MRATTSPLPGWNSLVDKVPLVPLLAFLLISLPLTALSIYFLPYFEFALVKFIWMVIVLLAVFLFQVRASMKHPGDRYLNALTSYPINFVALPTFYAGYVAFSSTTEVVQGFTAAFLGLAALLYAVYALVHNHTDGSLYNLLTRKGSPVVQFLLIFALVMVAVYVLPNPARAELDSNMRRPAATWQEQLSAAQAKVAQRDPNAVLSHVSASPNPLTTSYMNVSFYFVTDKPVTYLVSLQDWNPVGTANLTEYTPDNLSPAPEAHTADLATLRTFLPYIKTSPRDVWLLTVPDAKSPGGAWAVYLTLNPMSASLIPLWEVQITSNYTNMPTVIQSYSILADTGTILGSSPP